MDELLPSPKVQNQTFTESSDISVNDTFNGGVPMVGNPTKSEVGAAYCTSM